MLQGCITVSFYFSLGFRENGKIRVLFYTQSVRSCSFFLPFVASALTTLIFHNHNNISDVEAPQCSFSTAPSDEKRIQLPEILE